MSVCASARKPELPYGTLRTLLGTVRVHTFLPPRGHMLLEKEKKTSRKKSPWTRVKCHKERLVPADIDDKDQASLRVRPCLTTFVSLLP